MDNLTAAIKLQTSPEICSVVNELLRELQSRGHYVLDYENCECSLDHIEYHKAEDTNRDKSGDGSDNLYCFFREVERYGCK